jgi:hypothetical protein
VLAFLRGLGHAGLAAQRDGRAMTDLGDIVRSPRLRGRTAGLGALMMLALAACSADLPQTPPPADAVPAPGLYTLSPGTPVDGTARITLSRGRGLATGVLDMYGLQRSGDFVGTYRDVGDAASDLDGGLRLGNDNLVLMVVRATGQGLSLGVPPGGAVVTLQP